jgi:phosphatidylinositol-3-phosphatase
VAAFVVAAWVAATPGLRAQPAAGPIKTVFVIMFENHDWSEIVGSAAAPYFNSILPIASHAEQYFTPPGIHPSTPNYFWVEAGQDFGLTGVTGFTPAKYAQSTTNHLVTQLAAAGISWKTYQESTAAGQCPLTDQYPYAVRHNQFVFFTDVTNNNDPNSAYCIAHVRPYSELAADLAQHTVASYNFIVPNVCNDMHDCSITVGDTWLANELPRILSSAAYLDGGAVFITWDEGASATSDGPIGMIVLSPAAKGSGYFNSLRYTHSSLLLTVQEIFNVRPLLGDAANATDLSDLFAAFPAVVPSTPNPTPGASGVSTDVTLTWSSSGGSDSLYFGTSSPPPLIAAGIAARSYSLSGLSSGTTYYWRVVSNTASGSTTSPVWSFTSAAVPVPTMLTGAAATGTFGGTASATVTLATISGAPISGRAVSFAINAAPAGSAQTDAAGAAILSGINMTGVNAGSYAGALTVTFAGDASHQGSSTTGTLTVAPAATATALVASPSTIGLLQPVRLTATVTPATSSFGAVAGSMQFFVNGTPLGSSAVTSGTATLTANGMPSGADAVTATYVPDGNHLGSASAPSVITVAPAAASTFTFAISPSPVPSGQSSVLVAVVETLAGVLPTDGSVQFFDGQTVVGTANVASGVAATTSALTLGTHAIVARYLGTPALAASTSAPTVATVCQGVPPRAVRETLTISPASATLGQPVTVTAALSAAAPLPTGSIYLLVDNVFAGAQTIAPIAGAAGASVTIQALSRGIHVITVLYGGDAVFAAQSSSPAFIVVQ